jgi:hypothetical protein
MSNVEMSVNLVPEHYYKFYSNGYIRISKEQFEKTKLMFPTNLYANHCIFMKGTVRSEFKRKRNNSV